MNGGLCLKSGGQCERRATSKLSITGQAHPSPQTVHQQFVNGTEQEEKARKKQEFAFNQPQKRQECCSLHVPPTFVFYAISGRIIAIGKKAIIRA